MKNKSLAELRERSGLDFRTYNKLKEFISNKQVPYGDYSIPNNKKIRKAIMEVLTVDFGKQYLLENQELVDVLINQCEFYYTKDFIERITGVELS